MSKLNEHACGMVARVESVNLNAVAATTLYTVPTGKIFVPHYVVIRELSDDANTAKLTLGQTGDKDDFLGEQTLSGLDAAGAAGILMPVPNATTVKIIEYTEGEIFCVDVTAAAGAACTCTLEVFGTLMDA